MTSPQMDLLDRCPLCGATRWVEDSIPEPNLYSEKLAVLLGRDEMTILAEHANWRCRRCQLVFKRRWFPDPVVRQLFSGAVGMHPKGWDAVRGRFTPDGFLETVAKWMEAVETSCVSETRRGQRELLSIIGAIAQPSNFDMRAAVEAIRRNDVESLGDAARAIAHSIETPLPFTRFCGFRVPELWEYLQSRAGGFETYAEIGCPLWGLLSLAAESGCTATYLSRSEVNYWGSACVSEGVTCSARLLADGRVRRAQWVDSGHYPIIGVFQYLDHPTDPLRFLRELFDRADAAAVIVDAMDAPVAIQHVTGWTDASIDYAAGIFGKQVHADFDALRPSGSRLYLLADC